MHANTRKKPPQTVDNYVNQEHKESTSLLYDESSYQPNLEGQYHSFEVKAHYEQPNGGYGWVVVAASFINTCIIGSHFGCFSLLYPAITASFQSQYGISGWIGSLSQSMVYLPAILYGTAVNRYGCRVTTIIGSITAFVGYVLSSYCNSIPLLYVTYGVIAGTGIGVMFLPSIVIVQEMFTSKRALASGLSLSGLAIGVIVMAPPMQYFIETYTWRGAMFIYGAICLNGVATGLLFNRHVKKVYRRSKANRSGEYQNETGDYKSNLVENAADSNTKIDYSTFRSSTEAKSQTKLLRRLFDFSILKDANFVLYGIGTFCMNIGMNTFTMHTPSRALTYGISPNVVGLLPTVIGLGNISARIVFSFVSNLSCTNRTLQYGVGVFLAGTIIMCSTLAVTFVPIVVCCVIAGMSFGTSLTIQPTVLVDLFTLDRIANSQAVLNIFIGFASLLTTPFAGFLFDTTKNYNIPFLINGGIEVFGSCLILIILCIRRRTR